MPLSEPQKRSNSKHDKDNWQYITFKARTGSKDRIVEAASATGQSINGFIRDAISRAVMEATGKTMEPTHAEAAKAMLIRILKEEVLKLDPLRYNHSSTRKLEDKFTDIIDNTPSLYEDIMQVLSSDLPPKTKGKEIREIESKKRKELSDIIADDYYEI